jgi:hypothetical protein
VKSRCASKPLVTTKSYKGFDMVKFDEKTFTTGFVVPLLRKLGFKRIRYVHGIDEFGRDIVFFDTDRFGMPIVCGCQVKVGSIKGSQKKKIQTEIVPQLLEGIRTPYNDPETGDIYRIQRMYLIISGSLAGTAKEQIHALTASEPNICALDLQSLDLLAGGEGHETYFMFTAPGSDISYPAGLKFVPRLPLMHKGMLLSIGIDLGDSGRADFIEITEVSLIQY